MSYKCIIISLSRKIFYRTYFHPTLIFVDCFKSLLCIYTQKNIKKRKYKNEKAPVHPQVNFY